MTRSRCWSWEPAHTLEKALIVRNWIPCSLPRLCRSRAGWSSTQAGLSDHTQGKTVATVHDYYDESTPVLAASLTKRAPGYVSLGFPDPRKITMR